MYLRCNRRFKDGKEHCYWNIVEAKRCADGRVVQRQVLYLGEINDSQREAWCRVIEAFDEDTQRHTQLALFPAEREVPEHAKAYGLQVRLDAMQLHRPRQWGACWLACRLYEQLGLDHFWQARLQDSREGTRWRHILQTLVVYRLLDPGSEWRLHRLWFEQSAMGDLLGADYSLVEKNALYRCLDKVLPHKRALFGHLTQRWQDLFGARFDILLYDLTSTYFESPPPQDESDMRRYGYSRDKRPDCVQIVIALVVTPEGFPIAYEVLPGNTADKTTLRPFLQKIEAHYGKAERIWVMDRGIPTEDILAEMRARDPPVYYLVEALQTGARPTPFALGHGAPGRQREAVVARGRTVRIRRKPRPHPQGKRHASTAAQGAREAPEATSADEFQRQSAVADQARRGQGTLSGRLAADRLRMAASRGIWCCHRVYPGPPDLLVLPQSQEAATGAPREGRYLLRTNLCGRDPEDLWQFYTQLTEVEAAFKNLKDDLQLRPIYHQLEHRIEAHIFVAFMAYCLHVTLRAQLKPLAPGLTSRAVLDKLAAIQMLDVSFPTTDGRTLILSRYTKPNRDQQLLLERLNLTLPAQPPPRISAAGYLVHGSDHLPL